LPLFLFLNTFFYTTNNQSYIWPFLADFSIFEKEAKKQQKSKAMAFTFRPFLADFSIFEKEAKNSQKVRLL
jgi:purine-cytosine permease-like protein